MEVLSIKYKSELKEKVDNNSDEVITILQEMFRYEKKEDIVNALHLIHSIMKKIKYTQLIGIESGMDADKQLRVEKSKLLELIDEVKEDTAIWFFYQSSIFKRITLVCRSPERIPKLKSAFAARYYKRVDDPVHEEEYKKIDRTEKIDLIIYDNFPEETARTGTPPGLFDILDHTAAEKTPVLFYGPGHIRLKKEKYRDRVYFSNSKFSLHSRIQEMLLYLKHEAANSHAKTLPPIDKNDDL